MQSVSYQSIFEEVQTFLKQAPLPKFVLDNNIFLYNFSDLCRAKTEPLMLINLGVEERLDTLAKSEVQVLQQAAGSKS